MKRHGRKHVMYGLSSALVTGAPTPIIAQRAPTTSDSAEIGATWIDQVGDAVYCLVEVVNNSSTWKVLGGGSPTFTSLTINPGNLIVTAGQVTVGRVASTAGLELASTTTFEINAHDTVQINSDGGSIGIGNDADAYAINIGTGAAARPITIGNNTGATDVTIMTGTGGFGVVSSGLVDLGAATSTTASPTAAVTMNVTAAVATFTGFTTAAAATQQFTITNNQVTAASGILVSVGNTGANDAKLEIQRVTPAAGSFTIDIINNGAAALNGDILFSFLVMS